MITYVDTSMLIKLLVEEPGSDRAGSIWDTADTLATARVLYVEARAALAAARRTGRLSSTQHRRTTIALDVLWSQMSIIEITSDLVLHAAELAESDGLRGYDAMHLAAALLIGAEVVASADNELCAAATRHGVSIANPNDTDLPDPSERLPER